MVFFPPSSEIGKDICLGIHIDIDLKNITRTGGRLKRDIDC